MNINWIQAELEYISSNVTLKDLSIKYECTEDSIGKHAHRNNWTNKRSEYVKICHDKLKNDIVNNQIDNIKQMQDIERVKFQEWENEIERDYQEKEKKSNIDHDIFIKTMERLQRMKYKAYNVPDKIDHGGNIEHNHKHFFDILDEVEKRIAEKEDNE